MVVEILRDEKNHPIGWTMSPENERDRKKLEIIGDLEHWGHDDFIIKYDGRKGGDNPKEDPLRELKWIQERHHSGHEMREHSRRMMEEVERRKKFPNS